MKKLPSLMVGLAIVVVILFSLIISSNALGSGATISINDASATVCGIVAEEPIKRIECYRRGDVIAVPPNISFLSISGGRDYFCGLRSGNYSLLCWNTVSANDNFQSKRLYSNDTVLLENLALGDNQICATTVGPGNVICWRTDDNSLPSRSYQFASITSGSGFSCGILRNSSQVKCWGWGSRSSNATRIENEFSNMTMATLVAGDSHVCGLNQTGFLVCKGSNGSGQLNIPQGESLEYTGLALGAEHTCAIRKSNGTVICWGGGGQFSPDVIEGVAFELIVSGSNFICGLITSNFSVMCWGPGWPNSSSSVLPLPPILPGPCVQSCECETYGFSQKFCSGSGSICKPCWPQISVPVPPASVPPPSLSPSPPSSTSRGLRRGLLAFAIVGSVGVFAGICSIIYCLWTGVCFGKKKIHNSVQPTITRAASSNNGTNSNNSPPSRSSTIRRQGSRIMRRQRSGPSSTKHPDRAEEFTLAELVTVTNNFSMENKIGAGSYGVVYRGKLADGREVAIKRGETGSKLKKFQEKESAFESELAFLSRLHHKHLVRLVGFCEEKDERLLVYEYMKHGALYDHLHGKHNVEKSSGVLNSWPMRIKIALDASRGIDYLHSYAVPPIIHRDIKSSNILIDATWTARVSDFGLSLMGPESEHDYRPTKAVGTVGYIDPEYYGLNVLTAKSDVYGLGIVLLELLTGKRAIYKDDENGGSPVSVVDFAVPAILRGEMVRVLDPRVGPPASNEAEAVELVAYTAVRCVNFEGKERPTMADIVSNLERALDSIDVSHGSISSGNISIVSE
ncbi:hypothetical protein L6164_029738 [Bauhinia variegata]|uniref:Uncharacterized protein n=1 Tax=Bauhinia variegata TaxID=167791 RepID=A0ACB9LBH8_BAUVA|nr:hypothetical protein L6164_029738 [Bauhinia variegata]